VRDGLRARRAPDALHSIHPGASIDEVKARTGFELIVSDDVPVTPPPSAAELEMLRSSPLQVSQ